MSKVFDRGKESDIIKGFSNSVGEYECDVVTFCSCVFVLLGSLLLESYDQNLGCELFPRHGYSSKFQFLNWLVRRIAYVAKSGCKWNLDAQFSESNRFLFLLLARV
ncbi:hypothetical protein MKW92_035616, partial [Papaver armeniacum]